MLYRECMVDMDSSHYSQEYKSARLPRLKAYDKNNILHKNERNNVLNFMHTTTRFTVEAQKQTEGNYQHIISISFEIHSN